MSESINALSALPIGPTVLPREVREGTPKQQEAYRAALGFERVLVGQLLRSLGDDALGAGDSTPAPYKDLLPETMADSLTAGGGIGIAEQFYKTLPTEPR